jgi:hypothetical protein
MRNDMLLASGAAAAAAAAEREPVCFGGRVVVVYGQ